MMFFPHSESVSQMGSLWSTQAENVMVFISGGCWCLKQDDGESCFDDALT